MNELNNEQEFEQLLRASGQRATPPDDMRARVYSEVLDAWEALPTIPAGQVQRSPASLTGRWTGILAAAAGVMLISLVWFYRSPQSVPVLPQQAEVVHHTDAYVIDSEEAVGRMALLPGQQVGTTAGFAHLQLVNGATITLAPDTRLTYLAIDRLQMQRGRIYVDVDTEQQVWIDTPHAQVTDIGTQFDVAVEGNELIIAVREGAIDIHLDKQIIQAVAARGIGERLTFAGTQLDHQDRLAVDDEWWDWRKAGRPAYVLDGSTVFDYVSWMARDSGRHLEFGSRAVEAQAKVIKLEALGSDWTSDNTQFADALATTGFVVNDLSAYTWQVDFAGR